MHTYMDIDVASARMTEQGGGRSDYEYCASKSHTAALRVAASPGPRGLYITSSSCCQAAPREGVARVDSIHGKKTVVACICPGIALYGVFFPRENSLEKYYEN